AYATIAAIVVAAPAVVRSTPQDAPSALTIDSARVSIAGTSNIHPYTASTTAVRVTRAQLAARAQTWQDILRPGAIEAFEVSIPAATLSSPREGLDKNMHKALKVVEHPEITFRLRRLEGEPPGPMKAIGLLRIAGVEREVAFDVRLE